MLLVRCITWKSSHFANKNNKHTKTANKSRNKISKNSEFGNQIAEVNLARKKMSLSKKECPCTNLILSSWNPQMKDVKARHTNLKANHNKTKEAIKTNKKKYKQWKARTKGILDVWQTQRLMNKRQARKIRNSMRK